MPHMIRLLLFLFLFYHNAFSMNICTAADAIYFRHLLNFIGSLHKTNYDQLQVLMVYNLGLTEEQIQYLKHIEKLEVHEVRKVNPDILKHFVVHPNGKSVPGWIFHGSL